MTMQNAFKTIEIGIGKSSLAKEMITDLTQTTQDDVWNKAIRSEYIIETTVNEDVLAEYLTAEKGENLGIYYNGAYAIGIDIGNEIDIEERPITCVECPGINNIDTTHFTEDFVTYNTDSGMYEHIDENHEIIICTLEEVIYNCCRNGEVVELLEDLKNLLYNNLNFF